MSFLTSHRLHITPLSPVHTGCNEVYEPSNYVIDGNALFVFRAEQLMHSLPDEAYKALDKIVSGKADENMLKQVQAFFHQYREQAIAESEHFFPVGDGVVDFYKKRVGKTAQYENRGKQVINKLEIERSAYNLMDYNPVIVGSSLKGSIRTALLDKLNAGRALPSHIDRKKPNQQNQALQEHLFEGKFDTDPMRLISIADAHWAKAGEIPGNEIRFALNRQRALKDGERLQQSMAEEKGLYQILECVGALQSRCFTSDIRVQTTNNNHVLNHKNTPKHQWSVADIAEACNAFYRPLFEKETEQMTQLGYLDPKWVKTVNAVLRDMATKLDANQAFLLRVGRHSGAEALTLNGVRSIKIMGGKNSKSRDEDTPKTWWLAGADKDSEYGLMPFGWVLVEIDADESKALADQTSMDAFNKNLMTWFDKQQARKIDLANKFAKIKQEIQAKQAAEAAEQARLQQQKAQQAAEEQARQQAIAEQKAAEQAAFDALSDDKKAIFYFEQHLQKILPQADFIKTDKTQYAKQVGAGNQFAEKAKAFAEPVDKDAAVELLNQYFEAMGWHEPGLGGSKNKKKREKQKAKKEQMIAAIKG